MGRLSGGGIGEAIACFGSEICVPRLDKVNESYATRTQGYEWSGQRSSCHKFSSDRDDNVLVLEKLCRDLNPAMGLILFVFVVAALILLLEDRPRARIVHMNNMYL